MPGGVAPARLFAGATEVVHAYLGDEQAWRRGVEYAWTGTPHQSPSTASAGGVLLAENMVTNPELGTGTVGGWSAYQATISVVGNSRRGGNALRVTQSGTWSGRAFTGTLVLPEQSVEYTGAVWVRPDVELQIAVDVFAYSDTTGISTSQLTGWPVNYVTAPAGVWTRLVGSWLMPPEALSIRLVVRMAGQENGTASFDMVDAMLARTRYTLPGAGYVSGAVPSEPGSHDEITYAWTGAGNGSASTATHDGAEVWQNIIEHPDFRWGATGWSGARVSYTPDTGRAYGASPMSLVVEPWDAFNYFLTPYIAKPGNRVTLSWWVYAEAPARVRPWLWTYAGEGVGSGEGSYTDYLDVVPGRWQRLTATWQLTDATTLVRPSIGVELGSTVWLGAVVASSEDKHPPHYFDGDTADQTQA